MAKYLVDMTLSGRHCPATMREAQRHLIDDEGWEVRDEWREGETVFVRLTHLYEYPNLTHLYRHLGEKPERVTSDWPRTSLRSRRDTICIRDVSYQLEELLPYRYRPTRGTRGRPRGYVR